MKYTDIPSYQIAPTVGDLIEALKKFPKNSPWTTDKSGYGHFSVVAYNKDGNEAKMIVSKD